MTIAVDLGRKATKQTIAYRENANKIGMSTGTVYSKTCLRPPLKKRPKLGFQDRLSLNAGQKYCRMLPLEHSAKLSTFIKLPFVI